MTRASRTALHPDLAAELEGPPWMYAWPLGPGVTAPIFNPALQHIHQTRLEMFEGPVRDAIAQAGPNATVLDLACCEGWFAHRMLDWGAGRVVGVDIRPRNILRARLVRDQLGIDPGRLDFIEQDVMALDPAVIGTFDVVLVLGLVYHLEHPIEALRIARRLTRSLCIVESQLTRQDRPIIAGNGGVDAYFLRPASFAAFPETDSADNALASATGVVSLVPNRAALVQMPSWAGFDRVEQLAASAGHNRQYVTGDRGLVAAYVDAPAAVAEVIDGDGHPVPPAELCRRIGTEGALDQVQERFLSQGADLRRRIESMLPSGWSWEGRTALDFGCGSGRVLRHFIPEGLSGNRLLGCDIDRDGVAWINSHLQPPLEAFTVKETPGLPLADGAVDLIWAASVFTHITDHWAGWLLELRRVLRPDGVLIASFLGRNMGERFLGEWDEDRTGMNVIAMGNPWHLGGPAVFHSEWWLRSHWGRAFEVVTLDSNEEHPDDHSWVALRPRPDAVTVEDLVRPDPNDPREVAALRKNIEQLHAIDRVMRGR
ncbi:unannotated protein [freshwater metagenome]|uniref:Unannotated protein n=1 Tax=freshwater metagenome TaxID=449393 RepID=A0A6J7JAG5_9ZZZZ|nr:methyltransferase domain-containing protein [Actinomycetota bacterium]